ncbi:hypothetical protein PTTG_02754 [Puccinia triticina 1-1 BBBD Race 1]|uniref:AcidPPc domain-containing protein n=2 Tax=Puccinia triticina TaxID=208348 RepID=A0A180GWJ4_PUCT1|nr:uncharacterized protein PtA15_6A731 [Puccinia triticina]OAV97165.1 hypothetical protein PTTG_02754 [Puccinia triticina 1-1 BBBD Race 1]WAQ86101.1 hypothetical protein PtA15_6A731 [Puccinia triticina]WAR55988.1 hypothetical protein PtB15_6B732 [Puccinia triticina]
MIKPRIKSLHLIILREANIVITILTAISILYLRSAHSLWFGLGAIAATATAKILKRCIKQPRPTESTKKSFGMPSTHSSSITFYGIYLLLVCLLLPVHQRMTGLLPGSEVGGRGGGVQHTRTRNNEKDVLSSWAETLGSEGIVESGEESTSLPNAILRLIYGSIFILIAVVVCWSRIKLGHHTHKQVIAGAAIGGLIGVIWFGIWTGFKLPKVLLLGHYYYHPSSSPLSTIDRNELITIRGIGPYCELAFSRISILFAEAWYMRDFGLLWDGLIRPTINQIGFFLGFQDRIFDNGLPPNSNLHLIKPLQH